MIEKLFNDEGARTRVKNSFKWVITFRDFPAGCSNTIMYNTDSANETVWLYTKGRAEVYRDGVRHADRVPGSTSIGTKQEGGVEWKQVFTEPSTRICIPAEFNQGFLPKLKVHHLASDESLDVPANGSFVVGLGSVLINSKVFKEEQSFTNAQPASITALEPVILVEYV